MRAFFSCLLIFYVFAAYAQSNYGNEWVEYGNKPYYKIKVASNGIYRLSYNILNSLGLDSIQGSDFNLFVNGKVVPIYVTTTNTFGINDFIEFYGKKNDGSFDTQLYADSSYQPNPYYSLFTDTSVYFLTYNTAAQNIRINNVQNNLTNLPQQEEYFMHTIFQAQTAKHIRGKEYAVNGLDFVLGCSEPDGRQRGLLEWPFSESIFYNGEGFAGVYANPDQQIIIAPQIYMNGPNNANLKATIISRTRFWFENTYPHHLQVSLNSLMLADTTFTDYFRLNHFDFTLPLNQLANYNSFVVRSLGTSGDEESTTALIELTYPHEFSFPSQSKTFFTLNPGIGERYIEIYSFNDQGTAPVLYDLSNNIRIIGTQGTFTPHQFKLPAQSGNGKREIFLSSQHSTNITMVTSLEQVTFTNYYDPNQQGDYVIITHPKLRNDGNGNDFVNEYSQYRRSQQGGNHETEIVLINQLYDQFAYGIKNHPLAIRNFIDFALDRWSIKPEYLLLIGKGRTYPDIRNDSAVFQQCLIPTFGYPPSDNLLTATNNSITPRIPVGRLSVEDAANIKIYLDKVMGYEREQVETGDPYQTIEEKLWTKRMIHIGGGSFPTDEPRFRDHLEQQEAIIEDTLYGGDVFGTYKIYNVPTPTGQSNAIRDLMNSGVSMINIFGHNASSAYDNLVPDVTNLQNFERYHLLLSNVCDAGNIFNAVPTISDDFVFADGKGAIGFLSPVDFPAEYGLKTFTDEFYKNLVAKKYDESIGNAIKSTVSEIETLNSTPQNRAVAEQMTMHGDPAIRINTHAKPDYALEEPTVSFIPQTFSTNLDSFQLKVIVTNLGRAVDDSIDLIVTRYYPNMSDGSVSYIKRIHATYFSDTVYFNIPTIASKATGLNKFVIKIDNNDEVDELSETNNILGDIAITILADDVFPVYPYEFAIVPSQPVTLKASTASAFYPLTTYRMEIDTTELFNSSLKQSTAIAQTGGVLTWVPGITYLDNVVYYWRVVVDGRSNWHNSSFIYIDGEYPGWNQSHYYQFQKDDYQTMQLDSDRIFRFTDDIQTVSVLTGTADLAGGTVLWDRIAYNLNSIVMHKWSCGGDGFPSGIVMAVFDSISGNPWFSDVDDIGSGTCSGYAINTVHGNIHCKPRDLHGFDFPLQNSCQQQSLIDFINSIPSRNYILAFSVNNVNYNSWSQNLKDAFVNLGSTAIYNISNNTPWILLARKGYPAFKKEIKGNATGSELQFTNTFPSKWNQGNITTPLIGPAMEWGSVYWRYHANETQPYDEQSIDIIGVMQNGLENLLYSGVESLDTSIEFIDAGTYPYIKLRLNTFDDTTRTPTQLDYWRVLYEKVPEAALHPDLYFTFYNDTLNEGDQLALSVAVENVTDIHMDSLLVKYTFLTSGTTVNEYQRYDSLKAFGTMNLDWTYNTACNCLGEFNTLIIEVNPDNDQPEQYHFNNIGIITFKLQKDNINPLLDVTFDGMHILDGDIVSAYPEILISLKDENKFLLLNDTSLVNVSIQYGQDNPVKMRYDDVTMRFEPSAAGTKNTARVWLKKEFEQNGTYKLIVQAQDRSSNASGTYGIPEENIDFRISFEVIRETSITNVLNYPNPFTSATHFVFTLTGMRLPDYFKIQIMTVSGKIVRELTKFDLGPIHIGRNITDYAWNGTDEYGDPLANGLYLYRVVANIDDLSIEKMEARYDKYFEHGWGKMYLAR